LTRTDYERIAPRYDDNVVRHAIPRDEVLEARVAAREGRRLRALDVGCGTGNHLVVQHRAFGDAVELSGIDPSPAMLERARAKLPELDLRRGAAEQLPFDTETFDHVTVNFAFHHFEDKLRALDEIGRVSRRDASFRYRNFDVERMPGWWVYRFFPEAWLEDEGRFWSTALLARELERRGFRVSATVTTTLERVSLESLVAGIERRDVSELSILDDATYEAGRARVLAELARDAAASVMTETAIVVLAARRG
jgi:ubiquinone/menaquinone biosynthesis C-methylase UbiE